tara:strand:+ start:582 stop:1235 length:654 start_codon:yes stop_codon:yes gene_type:complete
MNYGELKAEIADYINRKDLTARIPRFIEDGEDSIYQGMMTPTGTIALRCRANLVAASLTPVEGVISLPTDFLELDEATYDGAGQDPLSAQFYNTLVNYTGRASDFSLRNDSWYQYPLPDVAATFDIIYFSNFSGTLVDDADTNAVLTAYPSMYRNAALAEAEIFIKNDGRAATWNNKLSTAIRSVNATHRRSKFSGKTMTQRTQYNAKLVNRVGRGI